MTCASCNLHGRPIIRQCAPDVPSARTVSERVRKKLSCLGSYKVTVACSAHWQDWPFSLADVTESTTQLCYPAPWDRLPLVAPLSTEVSGTWLRDSESYRVEKRVHTLYRILPTVIDACISSDYYPGHTDGARSFVLSHPTRP